MRNVGWIKPGNKAQQDWVLKYLINNLNRYAGSTVDRDFLLEISKGRILSADERAKMESAWRSFNSRKKRKTRTITVNNEVYSEIERQATRSGKPISAYLESYFCDRRENWQKAFRDY